VNLRTLSAEQTEEARALRASGAKWVYLAKRYQCDEGTVRRALDAGYRAKRAEQILRAKLRRADERAAIAPRPPVASIAVREDAIRLMAAIPADTRNLTQRIFGDPLPGRSALDRKSTLQHGAGA
jgi:hypothetical protein